MPQDIQLFAGRQIRTYWDDNEEEYYFCIIDVVETLTDSNDPKQYIKRMRQRDSELNSVWGTICTPHQFISSDGNRHQANCAPTNGILRIIQFIPSKKAEPFKLERVSHQENLGPNHTRGDGYTRIQSLLSQGQLPEDVKDYLLKSWAEIKTYEACTAYGLLYHCGL